MWYLFNSALTELWYTFEPIKLVILIHFWYTQKCIKYTLIQSKVYQIMIDDRKSYLNRMKCVWNGVKRYQILMYQKHVKSVLILIPCPNLMVSKVYQSSVRDFSVSTSRRYFGISLWAGNSNTQTGRFCFDLLPRLSTNEEPECNNRNAWHRLTTFPITVSILTISSSLEWIRITRLHYTIGRFEGHSKLITCWKDE